MHSESVMKKVTISTLQSIYALDWDCRSAEVPANSLIVTSQILNPAIDEVDVNPKKGTRIESRILEADMNHSTT